ncbi:MAG: glycyl-radical enzyme activating protein [Turicibacter sp.]|nr:glycyl-radical enzyme activating protein [Turicibacter sp.]
MKACVFNIQKFSLHDGPGIRTVVFFKGCPLRCKWCANPESFKLQPELMWDPVKKAEITVGEYKTLDAILDEVMKDIDFYEESGGGVTLSGGEVLAQAGFATELLKQLKANNIHTACETTGYTSPAVFAEFMTHVDLLFFDVKHYDNTRHAAGTGVSNELILANLATAATLHPNLLVRIPIIPNYNDTLEDASGFAKLLKEHDIHQVELLPFHQFGEKKYEYLGKDYALLDLPQLHSEDLAEHQRIFEYHGIKCRVR